MIITHRFKKKPSRKNLANRSLSFQNSEIELVSKNDNVLIDVYVSNGTTIQVKMLGSAFLKSTVDVGARDYKVLKF